MSDCEAVVTGLDGDSAWIEVGSDCSACTSFGGCGLGDGKTRRSQRVANVIGANVGDRVILSVPDGTVMRASFYCYVLPLALTLLGASIGVALAGDLGSIAGSLVGLIAGWPGIRHFGRREPAPEIRLKFPVVNFLGNTQT